MRDNFPFVLCPLQKRGLTLIELLLVIGIIAVLAGIIWVAFAPVKERAKRVSCISNLKQIGLAYQMYREDWEGLDPEEGVRRQYWELGLPNGCLGTLLFSNYIKDKDILFCPNWLLDPTFNRLSPDDRKKVISSYRCMYGPDEEAGVVGGRPFSHIIAEMIDYPIELCQSHDPYRIPKEYLPKDYPPEGKQWLGLTVVGEVKWYNARRLRQVIFRHN
jgi:prepilin-type N-terminal cleavage/methylation domain-containing protein